MMWAGMTEERMRSLSLLLLLLPGTRHEMELSQGYRMPSVWARAVCPNPSFCVSVGGSAMANFAFALTVSDTFSQMRVLVEEGGAFMNVTDRWGNTPLVEANRSGARPCASYLERRLSTQQKGANCVDRLYAQSLSYAGGAAPEPALRCCWYQPCHMRCQCPWV